MKLLFMLLISVLALNARSGPNDEAQKDAAGSASSCEQDAEELGSVELIESEEVCCFDFAPFFSCDKDLAGNRRWRALGPLIEKKISSDGRSFWAVRPFYSRTEEAFPSAVDQNAIWPIWRRRTCGKEDQWSFVALLNWYDWNIEDDASRYAFWALPFYFQGRDERGQSYRALLPVAGSIHDFLGQDEISFVLFPLYLYHRINEVETRGYPWPFLSKTSGGKVERFTAFPFYGRSKRDGQFDKYFVMWPFWSHADFYFEEETGYGYLLFPFYGHAKFGEQESFFVLPPLFRFGNTMQMNMIYCPWPFFQRVTGEEDKLYFWPIWGRKNREDKDTWFFLWPLFLGERHQETGRVEKRRFLFVPFVFHESKHLKSKTGPTEQLISKELKIWPLVSYQKLEADMCTQYRVPSLWPMKDYKQIERNYAPFWTLYSHAKRGDLIEDELLWGLFRYRRSAETGGMNLSLFPLFSIEREEKGRSREWSLLKGFIGCERDGEERALRLLYLFKIGI